MNHCDLEETKRLVDMRIDEALDDTAGWTRERRFPVPTFYPSLSGYEYHFGLFHPAHHIVAGFDSREKGNRHYKIIMNSEFVGLCEEGSPRFESFATLDRKFDEVAECDRLLSALNPPPAIDTTKYEWEVIASSENDPFDPHPLAVIGAGILIGIVLTIAALAIWGGA